MGLKELVFGDVEVEPEPSAEAESPATIEDVTSEEEMPWRRHRLCVVGGAAVLLMVSLLVVVIIAIRRSHASHVIVLAECPAEPEAVVIKVEDSKYAKVAADETSKVADDTSKNQL